MEVRILQQGPQHLAVGATFAPGGIPVGTVYAENLAHAHFLAELTCWELGVRVVNVKQGAKEPLAHDMSLWITVENPLSEPCVFTPAIKGKIEALEEYRLEVLYGVRDVWVGTGWDYTYHQRFGAQPAWMLDRIESTWREKGRITSRDFQMTTWIPTIDTRIDDPPCLQNVHCRMLPTSEPNQYKLNLTAFFRSRDLGKAFWMNAWALAHLQRKLAWDISDRLAFAGIRVIPGVYSDFSISNHLYGADAEKWKLVETLERMRKEPWTNFAMNSTDLFYSPDVEETRHRVAAQLHYASLTEGTAAHALKATDAVLLAGGIDPKTFPYPAKWGFTYTRD